jgi:hypothetical protein
LSLLHWFDWANSYREAALAKSGWVSKIAGRAAPPLREVSFSMSTCINLTATTVPQRLKPLMRKNYGTAEAVPFVQEFLGN